MCEGVYVEVGGRERLCVGVFAGCVGVCMCMFEVVSKGVCKWCVRAKCV